VREQVTRIKGILFYLVGFMIACDIYLTPITIVLYTLCWVIEGDFKNKFSIFLKNKIAILFVAFYLLHVIGLIYTKNLPAGLFDLQVKLSLLIFPIMLVSEGQLDEGKQKTFFYAFTAGLCLNGLMCLGYATWRYYTQNIFIFQYIQFSRFLHPSYYSMYIDVALIWIFNVLTLKFTELKKWEKLFLFFAIAFLEFMLVLLQSKTGQMVSILILIIALGRYMVLKKRWITGLIILVATAIIGTLAYRYVITSSRSRMTNLQNVLSSQQWDPNSQESTQVRHFAWIASRELITENPLLGTGTGYSRQTLSQQYQKDGFTGAFKEELNSLNEYYQVGVTLGIPGLIGLFAGLLIPLYKCIKEKRYIYLMFFLILMINFLTESMLETQGGTMFYGFFNSVLMFNFVI
jgi:hypothetical protein